MECTLLLAGAYLQGCFQQAMKTVAISPIIFLKSGVDSAVLIKNHSHVITPLCIIVLFVNAVLCIQVLQVA